MAELVVLVIEQGERINLVLDAWREAGVEAATVLDSAGMRRLSESMRMDDMPIFPSLANLMRGDGPAQKTVFAAIRDPAIVEAVIARTKAICGNLDEPGEGILFTVPVTRMIGLS